MGRWEPNARGRLEQAALELYVERGYEQTTVAEITARRAEARDRPDGQRSREPRPRGPAPGP
ncbi:hypothetical protein ACFUMJ_19680, partial [Streptomyces olivaceus]